MSDTKLYDYLDRKFEWNRIKAVQNAMKHRILFTEAATVFFDPLALFDNDPDHSEDENRLIVIGRSIRTKILIVVHVYRGDRTRIISAREPTARERSDYESGLGR